MKKLKILVSLVCMLGVFSFTNAIAMEKYSSNLEKTSEGRKKYVENIKINEIVPVKINLNDVKKVYNKILKENVYVGEINFIFDLRGVTRDAKYINCNKNNWGAFYVSSHNYFNEYEGGYDNLIRENQKNFLREVPSAQEEENDEDGVYKFFDESDEAVEEESKVNYQNSLEKFMDIKENIRKIEKNDISKFIVMLIEYLEKKKSCCLEEYIINFPLQYSLLCNLIELFKNFSVEFAISDQYNFKLNKTTDGKFLLKIKNENNEDDNVDYSKYEVFEKFIETIRRCEEKKLNLCDMFAFRATVAFFYIVMDEHINLINLHGKEEEKDYDEYFEKILKRITKKKGGLPIRIDENRFEYIEKIQNEYRKKRYGFLLQKYNEKLKKHEPNKYEIYVKPDLELYQGVKDNYENILLKAESNGVKFNNKPEDFNLFYKKVFDKFLFLPKCGEKYSFLNNETRSFEEIFYPKNVEKVSLSDDGLTVIFEFTLEAAMKFIFKLLDFKNYCNEKHYFDYFEETFCYADRIGQIALFYRKIVNEKTPEEIKQCEKLEENERKIRELEDKIKELEYKIKELEIEENKYEHNEEYKDKEDEKNINKDNEKKVRIKGQDILKNLSKNKYI